MTLIGNESCRKVWWESFDEKYNFDLKPYHILIILGDDFDYHEAMVISKYWKKWGAKIDFTGIGYQAKGHVWKSVATGWDRSEMRIIDLDLLVRQVDLEQYQAIFFPGGNSPVSLLREDSLTIVNIIQQANARKMTLAAICHGTRLFASADIIAGRRVTGHPDVYSYLEGAGAELIDAKFVVDDNLITTNWPYFETTAVKVAQRLLYAEFLQTSRYINSHQDSIFNKAILLTKSSDTDIERVEKLLEWVRDNYREGDCHSWIASEIIDCQGGSSPQNAILLTALCRAIGIPARLHLQQVTMLNDLPAEGTTGKSTFAHGIVGLNLNGHWHLYETTGKQTKLFKWWQNTLERQDIPPRFNPQQDGLLPSNQQVQLITFPDYFSDADSKYRNAIWEINQGKKELISPD